MDSWKPHLFPLSVAMPALVVLVLGGALILGLSWTLLNTIMLCALIVAGIVLEVLASRKIAELRFAEPPRT